jgi:hypothetical protein
VTKFQIVIVRYGKIFYEHAGFLKINFRVITGGRTLNSDKYKKIFSLFVTAALITSLIMNFTLLNRLNQLENQIYDLSNNQHNIINNINGQTGHIQSVMNDMKEQQSWISTINMEVDTKDLVDGQAEVTFEWQVKELQNDSEVVFNYVYGNSEEYTAIPAEEVQQGLFQVKIPIEVEIEPFWDVSIIPSDSSPQQGISKKEMEAEHMQDTLKYFVSVSYDDMVKSGEVYNEYIGKFGMNYYSMIQTDIFMNEGNLDISLTNHGAEDTMMVVKQAYLLKYEGEKLIGEEEIEPDNNIPDPNFRPFHLQQVKQYEDMRLVIKVVYSNGETFEKEVY